MVGATDDQVRGYLAAHPEFRCEGRRLGFLGDKAASICIDLRVKEPSQLVHLARLLAHLSYEEIHFTGAYLWVTTWGVWDDRVEAIGLKTLERFRMSYGELRSLEAAPGTCFRHDEFSESVCCLVQPMIIGWDAYYVPRWAYGGMEYFLTVSHDGFVDVEVRTKEMYEKILKVLKFHDWIKFRVAADESR